MRSTTLTIALVLAFVAVAFADVYMHSPRGSNNRNDDNNNAPANRLFDSQNNNAGGYNSGEPGTMMMYYTGSIMTVEWTNQHACGGNPNANCDVIIQYRCDEQMRNGSSRDRPQDPADAPADFEPTDDRGRTEPYQNWYECERRERNKGLFTADQNVGNQASSTRQNPNGGRSGYECAEERDYYPYWAPSYWKDVVVLTSNTSRCDYYVAESQNVKGKWYCAGAPQANNPTSCQAAGGTWDESPAFKDRTPNYGIEAPECRDAPYARDNMHTMAGLKAEDGQEPFQYANFNWTIPNEVSNACVLRLRYNVSTNDYDGWNTFSDKNGAASPITDDPQINIGPQNLQLDIDTTQFGRTFQDRSHVFKIADVPETVNSRQPIFNVNARGKRGNIVQVNPSLEYAFVPDNKQIQWGTYLHFQWQGSNNNPQGTDRHNFLEMEQLGDNYPSIGADIQMFGDFEDNEDVIYMLATSGGATDPNLQDVSPYFNYMPVRFNDAGEYFHMDGKNNAFSNRGQKGIIEVQPNNLAIGLGIAGGVVAVGGATAAVVYLGGASAVAGLCGVGKTAGQKSGRF
jgi:hypothetical protein